jgi:6-pyruvoyltetrahydropterin/6-carboxytetrahydropterin synthase
LNKDIPYFAAIVPTAENIAAYIQELLRQPIRELGATLHKTKLIESPNNSCEIYCTEPEVGVPSGQQQRESIMA